SASASMCRRARERFCFAVSSSTTVACPRATAATSSGESGVAPSSTVRVPAAPVMRSTMCPLHRGNVPNNTRHARLVSGISDNRDTLRNVAILMAESSDVPALRRGLAVLDLLTRYASPVSAATIARELDLPRSSTYHLLAELERAGFVTHLENQRRYGLG